jgi:hypothetical protein
MSMARTMLSGAQGRLRLTAGRVFPLAKVPRRRKITMANGWSSPPQRWTQVGGGVCALVSVSGSSRRDGACGKVVDDTSPPPPAVAFAANLQQICEMMSFTVTIRPATTGFTTKH